MALEDLTGDKYIDALVSANPVGTTDSIATVDNHIRGIKNVLKKTFPNLTGPVTVTASELNESYKSIPAGTKATFAQAAAPSGWTQDTFPNDKMLRVVSTAGGTTGGAWGISGFVLAGSILTQDQLPSHSHTVTTSTDGSHTHTFPLFTAFDGFSTGFSMGFFMVFNSSATATNVTTQNGSHVHTYTTSNIGNGQAHGHTLTFDGAWRPSYLDTIICIRA